MKSNAEYLELGTNLDKSAILIKTKNNLGKDTQV